jgi:transposase-like protein
LVLVAVEERKKGGIGRIRLHVITDASGPTLRKAIGEMIEKGSTIRTDGWSGYNNLKGYKHIVVKHQEEEPGTDPTPLVHRIASLLKRWLLGTHQGAVQESHLPYYLDEYTFRFNRRYFRSRGKLFYRLLEQCIHIPVVKGSSLKNSS